MHSVYDMLRMLMCAYIKGESIVHGVLSVVEELRTASRRENDGKNGIIDNVTGFAKAIFIGTFYF